MKNNNLNALRKAIATQIRQDSIENLKYLDPQSAYPDARARALQDFLTKLQIQKFDDGRLTTEKAIEIMTAKAANRIHKKIKFANTKIDQVLNSEDFKEIYISTSWKKCRTGNTCTATISVWGETDRIGFYTGKAGGYGYDKESSAIAKAFNQCASIFKQIYAAENTRLGKKDKESHDSYIGYGVVQKDGYFPYFDGGVGSNCYWKIFEKLGYKVRHVQRTENSDIYTITRK